MDVRRATPADAEAIAEVHIRSWQHGYRGLLPDGYLDGLRPSDRAGSYELGAGDDGPLTFVAVVHGTVGGFATVGPARDGDCAGGGEVYALYVHPHHWGSAAGTALLSAGCDGLREQGHRDAVLWVMVGNERAARFYAREGWEPEQIERHSEIWGAGVDEQRLRLSL